MGKMDGVKVKSEVFEVWRQCVIREKMRERGGIQN